MTHQLRLQNHLDTSDFRWMHKILIALSESNICCNAANSVFVRFYRNLTVGHFGLPNLRNVIVTGSSSFVYINQHLKIGRNLGRFVPGAPKSVVELAGDSVF